MGRHVFPNIVSSILVQATVSIPAAIIAEAVLSFLGLGVQPPTPSWGTMLNAAQAFLETGAVDGVVAGARDLRPRALVQPGRRRDPRRPRPPGLLDMARGARAGRALARERGPSRRSARRQREARHGGTAGGAPGAPGRPRRGVRSHRAGGSPASRATDPGESAFPARRKDRTAPARSPRGHSARGPGAGHVSRRTERRSHPVEIVFPTGAPFAYTRATLYQATATMLACRS